MDSPLAYVGGKSKLAKRIIQLIPKHRTYCEVFAGGGWVFFGKAPSPVEVINDLDSDLISFYRVLQNHLEEFLKQFKWVLSSREWWEDWNDQLDGRGLTDIQRAARYYYIQRLCFGGKVKNRVFGVAPDRPPRINLLRIEEELSQVHLRLTRVTIERQSWEEIVEKYDGDEVFFYLDPPYFSAPCYKHNFKTIDDYRKISERLKTIKGKFILSINDHEEIRRVFSEFFILPVTLKYSVGKESVTTGYELLIGNFDLTKSDSLF